MEQPEFLNELNPSQREAVEYVSGPSLVIAGAGSGKTRVLTYKIAYLLTQGMKPWEIMALTFTNKAAKEMKERISMLVGGNTARYLRMGTFHSVFSHILRAEANAIGYDRSFTIYDEADSRSLCKTLIKELGLDDKVYKPADVHCRISEAKNRLMLPQDYAADRFVIDRDVQNKMGEMARIYMLYAQRCRLSNAMDFDDLLLNTYLLFRNNPEIQQKYANAFQYFLVDEYQDTNYAQQQIILQLASAHSNVCVVGDDAQSIYSFRGANIDNILDFQHQYKGARLFKLEQNYRSTKRIVEAANSLIHKNERQIEKHVFSENSEGENLSLCELASDREEALCVCNDIQGKVRREGMKYSDFAILYRTNYQSRTFEDQMLKMGMPYHIYGGMSFYQRKEIKDMVAYLRLIVNPDDEEAFKRVINYPARGIGDTTVAKISKAAGEANISMWQTICEPERTTLNVNKGVMAKLTMFRMLIESFMERLITDDAFSLGRDVAKRTGITQDLYSSTEPEYVSRQENLEEFLSSMQDFVESQREQGEPTTLIDFLHDVALLTDKEQKDGADTPQVTLMTIHSAKGLEFPCVYVVGMEENIFPSPMCCDSKRKLEEERRLLYVAITRAEKHCMLTYAKSRYRYGRMEFDSPSRFLRDIDSRLISYDGGKSSFGGGGYGQQSGGRRSLFGSMPEYEVNTPYTGSRYQTRGNSRMQNNNPVASQFMADPKPKVTERKTAPVAENPFSYSFEQKLKASGANMRRVEDAMRNGGRASGMASSAPAASSGSLSVGDTVEHARFGQGVIKGIEGSGDSTKATVEFRNAGVKQLLLKFAKLRKI